MVLSLQLVRDLSLLMMVLVLVLIDVIIIVVWQTMDFFIEIRLNSTEPIVSHSYTTAPQFDKTLLH